jgi:N-carbamoyl-L-amino-acid hydrolase
MSKIAGEVSFSLDMRALDGTVLETMERRVAGLAVEIGARRGVAFELGAFIRAAPGPCSPRVRAELLAAAAALGVPAMEIGSGASHDAQAFAVAGVETAMLFIRNANGSHNPKESMELADFADATRVLARWLALHL